MKKPREKLKATSIAALKAYEVQGERIKQMLRKGRNCEQRILFLTEAFKTFFNDENFVNLLAVEKSLKIPKIFRERIISSRNGTP